MYLYRIRAKLTKFNKDGTMPTKHPTQIQRIVNDPMLPNPPDPVPVPPGVPSLESTAVSYSTPVTEASSSSSSSSNNDESDTNNAANGNGGADADMPPSTQLSISQSLTEEYSCCVCLEVMLQPTSLLCGHSGCLTCMQRSIKSRCCPVCREPVPVGTKLHVTLMLRNAINRLFAADDAFQKRLKEHSESLNRARTGQSTPRLLYNSRLSMTDYPATDLLEDIHNAGENHESSLSLLLTHGSTTLVTQYLAECVDMMMYSSRRAVYARSRLEELLIDISIEDGPYSPDLVAPPADQILCATQDSLPNELLHPNLCITDSMLRSLMRRSGVMAEHSDMFAEVRHCLRKFVVDMTKTSLVMGMESCTDDEENCMITSDHMVAAAKLRGASVFGYGGPGGLRYVMCDAGLLLGFVFLCFRVMTLYNSSLGTYWACQLPRCCIRYTQTF